MNDQEIKDQLFNKGLKHYRANEFYEAHEAWEDLWSDFFLEDKKFIQALIQLSVSFVHMGNNNYNGARSLLRKCKEKFEKWYELIPEMPHIFITLNPKRISSFPKLMHLEA